MNALAYSTISNMVLRQVTSISTPLGLWKKLDELYTVMKFPNKIYLLKRFFSFKMDFSKDLDENLDEFNKTTMALMSNGENIIDDHIVLNALLDSYSNLEDDMEHGRDTLTSEIVINSLRSTKLDLKMKGKVSTNGEGLFVRRRPTAKKN